MGQEVRIHEEVGTAMFNIDASQRFQEGYARGSQRRLGQTIQRNGMAAGRDFAMSRGMLDAGMALDQQIRGEEAARAAAEAEREQMMYDRSVDQRDYQLRALEFAHQQDMDQLRFAYQQTQDAAERERLEQEMALRREEFQFAQDRFAQTFGLERRREERADAELGLEFQRFDRENEQYMDEMETEEEARLQELRTEAFDLARPLIGRALEENQGNPEGFRAALGAIAGQLESQYPDLGAEIASEVNRLAQADMQDLKFMMPIMEPDETESERLIAGLLDRGEITEQEADEIRRSRLEYIAGRRSPTTTINVPGIVGYDDENRPIYGTQPLELGSRRDAATEAAAQGQQSFFDMLSTVNVAAAMPEGAFGARGNIAAQTSVLGPFFGQEAADEAAQLLSGGADVGDLQRLKTETELLTARAISVVTGEEERFTDVERQITSQLSNAQTLLQTREGFITTVSLLATRQAIDANRNGILSGRGAPFPVVDANGNWRPEEAERFLASLEQAGFSQELSYEMLGRVARATTRILQQDYQEQFLETQ